MMYKKKPLWVRRLEEWLEGKTLEQKMLTLEHGKLLWCTKCKRYFFSEEPLSERRHFKCKPAGSDHECVEANNYIVLRRCFRGIAWVVDFPDSVTPDDAIIDYFRQLK